MIEPRRLALLMALLGGLLLLQRLLEVTGTPGLDFGTAPGRARLIGAMLSRPAMILLGDALLIGAAVMLGSEGPRRTLGVLHTAGGATLLVALPVFWFSAARVAESLRPQEFGSFRLFAIRMLLLLAGLSLGALGAGRVLLRMAPRPHPTH